jgi:putative sigma-54 modulation protein
MNISITGRQLELTDAIKSHIATSVETLTKYNLEIISVNTIVSTQTKKGKEHSVVEFVINLAHKSSIIIKQNDADLYSAIDIAIARAQKAMRRMHDREVEHHKVGLNVAKAELVDVKEEAESLEDEIVPVELDLYKPREVEDVLNDLKDDKNKIFEIFQDNDGKTRVLYKRNDGKFGLY